MRRSVFSDDARTACAGIHEPGVVPAMLPLSEEVDAFRKHLSAGCEDDDGGGRRFGGGVRALACTSAPRPR